MKVFKGTNGEWLMDTTNKTINRHNEGLVISNSDKEIVCFVNFREIQIDKYSANAKLIASAPELLDVLQDILNDGLNPETYKVAQKAISKALD